MAESAIASKKDAHAVMRISRFDCGARTERLDSVIQEVGIEVVVDGMPAFTATCSPWGIEELVVGRLFFEGIVNDASMLDEVRVDCRGRVDVRLRRSACRKEGSCAIVPFDALRRPPRRGKAERSGLSVTARTLDAAMGMLEGQSLLFRKTGGVHSAVLADRNGEVRAWCEDIGRHSAVDKVAGRCLLRGIDASECMMLFSGRVPQEIISKVVALGCPLVASPGAPTSLSIETAKLQGVTLVGFAKKGRFNVYAHPERIVGYWK